MQKIILVEGLDRSGKSTIAKKLSNILNIPYFKFEKHRYWEEKKYELATYFDQPYLCELLKQTNYSLIIDRGYPSEFAYAPLFDRELDLNFLRKVDDSFAESGTVINPFFSAKSRVCLRVATLLRMVAEVIVKTVAAWIS